MVVYIWCHFKMSLVNTLDDIGQICACNGMMTQHEWGNEVRVEESTSWPVICIIYAKQMTHDMRVLPMRASRSRNGLSRQDFDTL